jgi:hypothetical protein
MAHFAEIEPTTGRVIQVIVAEQGFINSGAVGDAFRWVQTSYNTSGGIHYNTEGVPDSGYPLRMNSAEVGGIYNKELDVFYKEQPYDSWVLDNTFTWVPPVSYPSDNKSYGWNEDTLSWVEVEQV